MGDYSRSVSREQGLSTAHDQREYTPKSAEASLEMRNIVLKKCVDHKAEFNDFFRPHIERYNAQQKRKDRQKGFDYYSEVDNPESEFVFQIGNRETLGVLKPEAYAPGGIYEKWEKAKEEGKPTPDLTPWLNDNPDREKAKAVLVRIGEKFEERYPNFHVSVAALHDDEPGGGAHLHIGGFMHAEGYHRKDGTEYGVQSQCSFTRALSDMGFSSVDELSEDMRDWLEEEMEDEGLGCYYVGCQRSRLKTEDFKKLQKERIEIRCREADVSVREKAATRREAVLRTRERALDERERELEEREAAVAASEASLSDFEARVGEITHEAVEAVRTASKARVSEIFQETKKQVAGERRKVGFTKFRSAVLQDSGSGTSLHEISRSKGDETQYGD